MTPPDPPPDPTPPTHQSDCKRRHRKRHAQQHSQPPEEPPAPAGRRRADGFSPAEAEFVATKPKLNAHINPVAPGDDLQKNGAVDEARREAGELVSSRRSSQPPNPAARPAAGEHFHPAGIVVFGDLRPIGSRRRVEGVENLAGVLPDPPRSQLPANAIPLNSGGTRLESARRRFDDMPVRDRMMGSVQDVATDDGEVLEKGPEMIMREGSCFRAIFNASSLGTNLNSSEAGGAEQIAPMDSNVKKTKRPGGKRTTRKAWDTLSEGAGVGGIAPDPADKAAGRPSSGSQALQAEQLMPTTNNAACTQQPGVIPTDSIDANTCNEGPGRHLNAPDRPGGFGGPKAFSQAT